MASASSVAKQCFNSNCKIGLEQPRKGWRRRTGDYADLCDRCASAYEEGKFCESFHLNASGWRSCESCGKQIHCGCIVSFHMFVLLDAGGIECINCTRRSFILTPNPAWPPPSLILPGLPDSIKDLSVKNWSSIASSGPVPWRQAPSLFHSEMHPKTPFEVDKPSGFNRLLASERLCASSLDMNKIVDFSERLNNQNLKTGGASQIFENGTSGSKFEEQPNPYVNAQKLTLLKNEPFTPHFSLTVNTTSKSQTSEQTKASRTLTQPIPPHAAAGKQFCSPPNRFDSSSEAQTRNGRPQGPNQLLQRYWPRTTREELQQISGASNTVMTPLFEKMLSASDAGKIGRLVLPKKCAETYFPPISNPEGMPLMVQDLKGTEWAFHFRFWPNNNSRMYVLEGVTPCIQSLQLQAGDRVTFSRLEPEGKLVIGGRKAYYAPPSNQSKGLNNIGNGASVSSSLLGMKQANSANPSTWLEVDKPVFRSKRKSNKRIRIESEEMIELKLNWEQAQGLFRPPPNNVPRIVVIEGYEFEEFEEPPIIGRPTILATDHVGKMIQWVQCEDCLKWRKLPGDILFPSRWTCSGNLWDLERSICSVAQELTAEELEDLVPTGNQAGAKKIKVNNEEPNPLEALEGLDALADLAIQDEGDAQATTTKHPRHKPGCSCIVCIQPPSGRGPKHKHTCTCNVCLTVKRRFRTLMLNREKKQSGKEAEVALQMTDEDDIQLLLRSDTGGNASPSHTKMVKGQIDLNIQPEREEESSPVSDSGSIMKFLQDATERYLKQQKLSARSPMHHSNGVGVGNLSNVIIPPLDGGHQNATNSDYPPNLTSN